jgi:alanine racemase
LCAVVKCDAYGHGIVRVVDTLKAVVGNFAVSSIDDAIKLRVLDRDINILNIGVIDNCQIALLCKYNIIQSVHNIDSLQAMVEYAQLHDSTININIKINSGFNRLGLDIQECKHALRIIKDNCNIHLYGVYSHFCQYIDTDFCDKQYKYFEDCSKVLQSLAPVKHCASSNGLGYSVYHADMIRCGIALYGVGNQYLKQVMHISSKIVQLNYVLRGQRVGYNNTILSRDSWIATVEGGYGQGMLREIYKCVLVDDIVCPIVGNICMDFFMIDVTHLTCQSSLVGHSAILTNNQLTWSDISKDCTIPYQLMTASNTKDIDTVYVG